MKVLLLATDVFTRGGIARYTSTLASSLADLLGPENVDVLCFFDWGHAGETPTNFRLLGSVSSRKHSTLLPRLRFLGKAWSAGSRGYDLVIANHVALAPVAALLNRVFGIPYWVACHSIEIWWGTTRARHAALKRADLILPVSRYTAEIVQQMKGIDAARVKVLYNAIPDSLTRALSADSPAVQANRAPMLLSVTALVQGNEFKGIDTVIEALPRVLATVPDLQYVVAGDGELRPKLESLAAKAGVAANVRFLGGVSDAELVELYRRCDLFVLPSRGQQLRGAIGGEGFGRVYVEAALAGKPVIGSSSGGAAEAVLNGVTGLLVNPQWADDVADAVLALLTDRERAAAMGAAGRQWALETFSQHALRESLQRFLQPYGWNNSTSTELAHASERNGPVSEPVNEVM